MSYEGQYHPKLVTATIGNPVSGIGIPITVPGLPQGFSFPATVVGRATDSFFTVTNAADMISTVVGAEGNVTHVVSHDESGNFTITLTRGSNFNRLMGIMFRAQRLIGEGQVPAFTFPVTYRDNNSTPPETHEGLNCMILRQPDVDYGASDGTVAWGFVAAQVISNFSGRVA